MSVIDTTSLVLHVLAAAGIVAGGVVQVMAGTRVRQAVTGRDLVQWAGFARSAGLLIAASALVSVMTGGHLAGAVWGGAQGGFSNPFITLGMVGWLLLIPVGPMIGGARLRRLAEGADGLGDGPLPTELATEARHPAMWGAIHSLVGVSVGFIWLMSSKPDWIPGVIGLLLTFGLGWVAGAMAASRTSPA